MNNNYNPYFNYQNYPNYSNLNTRYIPNNNFYNPINTQPLSRGTGILSGLTRSPGLFSSAAPSALGTAGAATGAAAKTFSFTGLLNGASKTLGVINQAIPVVYQIKPIWNNAKTMFRVAKAMGSKDTNITNNNTTNNTKTSTNSSDNTLNTNTNSNNYNNSNDSRPTFFA